MKRKIVFILLGLIILNVSGCTPEQKTEQKLKTKIAPSASETVDGILPSEEIDPIAEEPILNEEDDKILNDMLEDYSETENDFKEEPNYGNAPNDQ